MQKTQAKRKVMVDAGEAAEPGSLGVLVMEDSSNQYEGQVGSSGMHGLGVLRFEGGSSYAGQVGPPLAVNSQPSVLHSAHRIHTAQITSQSSTRSFIDRIYAYQPRGNSLSKLCYHLSCRKGLISVHAHLCIAVGALGVPRGGHRDLLQRQLLRWPVPQWGPPRQRGVPLHRQHHLRRAVARRPAAWLGMPGRAPGLAIAK